MHVIMALTRTVLADSIITFSNSPHGFSRLLWRIFISNRFTCLTYSNKNNQQKKINVKRFRIDLLQSEGDSEDSGHNRSHGDTTNETQSTTLLSLNRGAVETRLIGGGFALIEGAVPAVAGEALLALVGDLCLCALKAAGQHGATDTDGPLLVTGGVGLGDDIPAVLDNGGALVLLGGHLEGGDVGLERVREVGQVDDKWGLVRGVFRVAAEEDGLGVEAEVEEGVLTRDNGEAGAVGDALNGTLVGGDGGGAVGPAVVCVG